MAHEPGKSAFGPCACLWLQKNADAFLRLQISVIYLNFSKSAGVALRMMRSPAGPTMMKFTLVLAEIIRSLN